MPPSSISRLSSGQFVGIVADDPQQRIELKAFSCEILNDHSSIAREDKEYKAIPNVRDIHEGEVMDTYRKVKKDVSMLVEAELIRMLDTPSLAGMIIGKNV